jgi:hypothetical protein
VKGSSLSRYGPVRVGEVSDQIRPCAGFQQGQVSGQIRLVSGVSDQIRPVRRVSGVSDKALCRFQVRPCAGLKGFRYQG